MTYYLIGAGLVKQFAETLVWKLSELEDRVETLEGEWSKLQSTE